MIPTNFRGATGFLKPPARWDEDEHGVCDPLPFAVIDGCFVSMWVPDRDELAALNAGAAVQISIMAPAHPPVAVGVGSIPAPPSGGEHG